MKKNGKIVLILIASAFLIIPLIGCFGVKTIERNGAGYEIDGITYEFTGRFRAIRTGEVIGKCKNGLFKTLRNDPDRLFMYLEAKPFHEPYNLLYNKAAVDAMELTMETIEVKGKKTSDPVIVAALESCMEEEGIETDDLCKYVSVKWYYKELPQVYDGTYIKIINNKYYVPGNNGDVPLPDAVCEWLDDVLKTGG